MKKLMLSGVLVGLFIFFATNTVSAQSDMQPKKYENAQWKNVVFVDYKSGKYARSKEIISKYFAPASEKAGTPGPEMVLEMNSGEWDIMYVWGMKGGIADLNWETSPDDIAWRKALNEIAGGADKAQAILDEFSSLVNRSSNQIGRVR